MIKVLVIGMTDNPGGMESCIMNYYRNIDKVQMQFDFLTYFDDMVYREEVIEKGSRIFVLPLKGKNPGKYKREVNYFFSKHALDYDVIWYNTCSLANIDYLKLAKKYGIKRRIIHAHNSQNDSSALKGLMHQLHRCIIGKYATDYWCCSWDAADYFFPKRICEVKNVLMINNAINVEKFKFDEEIRSEYRRNLQLDDKIVIGNVGRFHMQKNHSFLIDIFYELVQKDSRYFLLLVGQGDGETAIRNKVKKLGIEDKVSFLGARNDVDCLLQAMDLFLFPSLFEGLGIALVEAQAAGLVCFTSAVVVPQSVNLTGLVKYISLEQSKQGWAEQILKTDITLSRNEYYKNVISAGFDIQREAVKMVNLLDGKEG